MGLVLWTLKQQTRMDGCDRWYAINTMNPAARLNGGLTGEGLGGAVA